MLQINGRIHSRYCISCIFQKVSIIWYLETIFAKYSPIVVNFKALKVESIQYYYIRIQNSWLCYLDSQASPIYLVAKSCSLVGHKTRLLSFLLCWLDIAEHVWQRIVQGEELVRIIGIRSLCSFCSALGKQACIKKKHLV